MLASGENQPNLIPAITRLSSDPGFKADAALILASKSMQKQAGVLKYALEHSGVGSVHVYPEICPDFDLKTIREWANEKAEEIAANYQDNRRILNLTGGTKLMTIAFLEAFQNCGTEIIYCDTEHGRIEYIDNTEHDPKLPVNVLKLKSCLAAQGYGFRNENPDTAGINAREELTRKFAGKAHKIDRFIQSLNKAWYRYDTNKEISAKVETDRLGKEGKILINDILALNLLKPDHSFQDESAARYLGGGWLEEWCWIIGKELEENEPGKRLKGDRWGINLKVDFLDTHATPGRNSAPLNELDAVYIHRNRMLLIECKTGTQVRTDSQNILNKLEALGQQFGGRLNTKWLLSARRISPTAQAWERARNYRIRIVEPHEIASLKEKIQEWMTR
jgi:hypothetical protein